MFNQAVKEILTIMAKNGKLFIFGIIGVILLILFLRLKNKLKRDAYEKGEENRKKRFKK